ncbi:peroxisomal membrane anchor protein conserved region-domain-containing protein [Pisolithus albus]|nr:peroxisomal membrane anchor protein conserved region-domain-containing protein [Pisolithus albus]
MTTPDRQDLIKNAVAFLSDFSTQKAPLAQRVQFLEAKGLTGPEIEEAMKQAANKTPPPQPSLQPQPFSVLYGPSPYNTLQPQPWDWRDYFITAVISGTVVYGAVSLFKKYLAPHLKPPAATAYEQDRDALTAQFDAAEALLREIQDETASVRAAVEEQREKVDKATKDVESVVVEMREGEARTRDEMREIRDEVENIREMLPKMIENNKEAQKQSLSELQQELKSLKTLLLSRGGTLSSTPSTPLPALAGKPSIPSWQLIGASSTPSSEPATGNRTGTFTPPIQSSGKGKEVEVPVDHAS